MPWRLAIGNTHWPMLPSEPTRPPLRSNQRCVPKLQTAVWRQVQSIMASSETDQLECPAAGMNGLWLSVQQEPIAHQAPLENSLAPFLTQSPIDSSGPAKPLRRRTPEKAVLTRNPSDYESAQGPLELDWFIPGVDPRYQMPPSAWVTASVCIDTGLFYDWSPFVYLGLKVSIMCRRRRLFG